MPNHFHLMVYVRDTSLGTHRVINNHPVSKERTLNDSIAIMLRSYTRGVNKEQKRSGSIFREDTKAVCLTTRQGIIPSWFTHNGITQINLDYFEDQYLQVCFNYIHQNPVKHRFVRNPRDWDYSSFREYMGKSNRHMVNKSKTEEIGLIVNLSPGHSPGDLKLPDEW